MSKYAKIARVFPRKTSMSPTDKHCYFGEPDLFTPEYNEVHISVLFTWDIAYAYYLKDQWEMVCDNVKIGGPAFNDPGGDFTPGVYIKKGVTITSRGCPNRCAWCFVPRREGKLRELPIMPGNIIGDNNLLACSISHIDKVVEMLKTQRAISFNQGIDSRLLTDRFVEQIRGLRIKNIWLAMDYDGAEKPLKKAVGKLAKYFYTDIVNDFGQVTGKKPDREKIRCYVLIGYEGDTIDEAEGRLRQAWDIGTLPFAMRYRTPAANWRDTFVYKDRAWNLLTRKWTRPAIIKTRMRG